MLLLTLTPQSPPIPRFNRLPNSPPSIPQLSVQVVAGYSISARILHPFDELWYLRPLRTPPHHHGHWSPSLLQSWIYSWTPVLWHFQTPVVVAAVTTWKGVRDHRWGFPDVTPLPKGCGHVTRLAGWDVLSLAHENPPQDLSSCGQK